MRWQDRAQEWLADRVSWVQYPNIRLVSAKRAPRRFFKHQMPGSTRVTLVLLSLTALLLLIPAMIAGCFFLYAFLGAVFGWIKN